MGLMDYQEYICMHGEKHNPMEHSKNQVGLQPIPHPFDYLYGYMEEKIRYKSDNNNNINIYRQVGIAI